MRIFTKAHRLDFFNSKIFNTYFDTTKMAIFDIETLGLNSAYCEVVLASIFSVDEAGEGTVKQFFIDDISKEKELLLAIKDELNRYETIITYNGKNFDMPFILNRAKKCGIEDYHISPFNLDLYLLVRSSKNLKDNLKSLKQKGIEEYMGVALSRDDEISGKESVDLYYQYVEETNINIKEQLLTRILLHNHDDVVQLYKILGITAQMDFHGLVSKFGFKVSGVNNWMDFTVTNIKLINQRLFCNGTYIGAPVSFVAFEDNSRPYSVEILRENKFIFSCPLFNLKGSLFLNLRSFNIPDTNFINLPGYVNGFLIIQDKYKQVNNLEVNLFTKHLITKFMLEHDRNM